jgi:ribosomal protein L18
MLKNLPNCVVVGQETSRQSLAEIVDQKSLSKSIEATSRTSTLGGQQNKGNSASCAATGLTCARTGLTGTQTSLTGEQPNLTASPRFL